MRRSKSKSLSDFPIATAVFCLTNELRKSDYQYLSVITSNSHLKSQTNYDTDLSSTPSSGFLGSGSLFKVLQPFNPVTDAPLTEACVTMLKQLAFTNFSSKYKQQH